MNVVLFGAEGTLGSELVAQIPQSGLGKLHAFSHREADIANEASIVSLIDTLQPKIIINAAAYNAVDQAEDDALTAFRVNSIAPALLALHARRTNAVLVHYSTDFVFDGCKKSPYTEEDPTEPLSTYARSKYLGETAVLSIHPQSYVLRTASVFGSSGNNFFIRFLHLLEKQNTLQMTNDLVGSPTPAIDLARATLHLLQKKIPFGLYHAAGNGACSRYEWAKGIAEHCGYKVLIEPVSSQCFATKAKRPAYSVLSSMKLAQHGIRLRSWHEALPEIFAHSGETHA